MTLRLLQIRKETIDTARYQCVLNFIENQHSWPQYDVVNLPEAASNDVNALWTYFSTNTPLGNSDGQIVFWVPEEISSILISGTPHLPAEYLNSTFPVEIRDAIGRIVTHFTEE